MDWAGAQYEVDFLKKNSFGVGRVSQKLYYCPGTGLGLGNCTFADIGKKYAVENDADGV